MQEIYGARIYRQGDSYRYVFSDFTQRDEQGRPAKITGLESTLRRAYRNLIQSLEHQMEKRYGSTTNQTEAKDSGESEAPDNSPI